MNLLLFTSLNLDRIPKSTNTYQRVSLRNTENRPKAKKYFLRKTKVIPNRAKAQTICSSSYKNNFNLPI